LSCAGQERVPGPGVIPLGCGSFPLSNAEHPTGRPYSRFRRFTMKRYTMTRKGRADIPASRFPA